MKRFAAAITIALASFAAPSVASADIQQPLPEPTPASSPTYQHNLVTLQLYRVGAQQRSVNLASFFGYQLQRTGGYFASR